MNTETLRGELKVWEKSFLDANGRRPGREDIKNDASIAAKYKQYDQLRRLPPPPLPASATTPRKSARQTINRTPSKRALKERSANVPACTPQKGRERADKALSPVKEENPTPAYIRRALGPTPQRDGQVLGIFDMLPSATPSKPCGTPSKAANATVSGTPSKQPAPSSSEQALSRTPASSGKRAFFDAFINGTPLKRKRGDNDLGTPSTVKRQFATPQFLRRSTTMTTIDEEQEERISQAPPFKRRSLVKSLSSIIQGLRKQEEQRMDDEWDVLNELEAEAQIDGERPQEKLAQQTVLVEDSQSAADMPLGPDQGETNDSDDGVDPGALGPDGQPRKVWKKKGLKRQTKRTKMKPVLHKPQKAAELVEAEEHVVEETQLAENAVSCNANAGDGSLDNEESTSKNAGMKAKNASTAKISTSTSTAETKKAAKKTSSTAHANFRRLKIKSKNTKPKGGRFGRR